MAESKSSRSDVPETQSTTNVMSWLSSASRFCRLFKQDTDRMLDGIWQAATSSVAYVQDYVVRAPEPILSPDCTYLRGIESIVGLDLATAENRGRTVNLDSIQQNQASLDVWLKHNLLNRYLDDKAQFLLPDSFRPDEMGKPKGADEFKTLLVAYCRGLRYEDVIDIFYGLAKATDATLNSMEKHFYSRKDKAKDRYKSIRNYLAGLKNDLLQAAQHCEHQVNLTKPATCELPPEPPKEWLDYVPTQSQVAAATSTALSLCVQVTKQTARFAVNHPFLTVAAVGYLVAPVVKAAAIRENYEMNVNDDFILKFSELYGCNAELDANHRVICNVPEIEMRLTGLGLFEGYPSFFSVRSTADGPEYGGLVPQSSRFGTSTLAIVPKYNCTYDVSDAATDCPRLVSEPYVIRVYNLFTHDLDPSLITTNGTDNPYPGLPNGMKPLSTEGTSSFTGIPNTNGVFEPDGDGLIYTTLLPEGASDRTPPAWVGTDSQTGRVFGTRPVGSEGRMHLIQNVATEYDSIGILDINGDPADHYSNITNPFYVDITNNAPTTKIPPPATIEGQSYVESHTSVATGVLFDEPDGNDMSVTMLAVNGSSIPPGLSYRPVFQDIRFMPDPNYRGTYTVQLQGCDIPGRVCAEIPSCEPAPPICVLSNPITIKHLNMNPAFTRGFAPTSTRVGSAAQQTAHSNQRTDGDGDPTHCVWGMQDGSAMPMGTLVFGEGNCTLKWVVQPGTTANTYNFINTLHDDQGGTSEPEVWSVFVQDQGVENKLTADPDIGSGPFDEPKCVDFKMPLSDPDHHEDTADNQLAADITPVLLSPDQTNIHWNTTRQAYTLCASPIAGQSGLDLTVIIAKSPASFTGRYHVTNPGPHQTGSLRLVTSEAGQPWSQSKAGICGHADPVLAESVSMNLPFLPAGLGQDANSVFATSTILPNTQSGPQQITATCTDARGATFTVFGTLESPFSKPTIEPVAPVTRQVDPTGLLPNPAINLDVASLDGSVVTATLAPGSSEQLQRMVSFSGSVGTGAEHTGIQMHMHLSPGDNQPTGDAPYIVNALVQSVAGGTSTPFSFELGVPDQPLVTTPSGQTNFNIDERGTLRPLDSAYDPDGTDVDFVDFVEPPELALEPPLAPIVTRDPGSDSLGVRFPDGWNRHGPFNITYIYTTPQQGHVTAQKFIDWNNRVPTLAAALDQSFAPGQQVIFIKPTCTDPDGHQTLVSLSSSQFNTASLCTDSETSLACNIPPSTYSLNARCVDVTYTHNGTRIQTASIPNFRTFGATINGGSGSGGESWYMLVLTKIVPAAFGTTGVYILGRSIVKYWFIRKEERLKHSYEILPGLIRNADLFNSAPPASPPVALPAAGAPAEAISTTDEATSGRPPALSSVQMLHALGMSTPRGLSPKVRRNFSVVDDGSFRMNMPEEILARRRKKLREQAKSGDGSGTAQGPSKAAATAKEAKKVPAAAPAPAPTPAAAPAPAMPISEAGLRARRISTLISNGLPELGDEQNSIEPLSQLYSEYFGAVDAYHRSGKKDLMTNCNLLDTMKSTAGKLNKFVTSSGGHQAITPKIEAMVYWLRRLASRFVNYYSGVRQDVPSISLAEKRNLLEGLTELVKVSRDRVATHFNSPELDLDKLQHLISFFMELSFVRASITSARDGNGEKGRSHLHAKHLIPKGWLPFADYIYEVSLVSITNPKAFESVQKVLNATNKRSYHRNKFCCCPAGKISDQDFFASLELKKYVLSSDDDRGVVNFWACDLLIGALSYWQGQPTVEAASAAAPPTEAAPSKAKPPSRASAPGRAVTSSRTARGAKGTLSLKATHANALATLRSDQIIHVANIVDEVAKMANRPMNVSGLDAKILAYSAFNKLYKELLELAGKVSKPAWHQERERLELSLVNAILAFETCKRLDAVVKDALAEVLSKQIVGLHSENSSLALHLLSKLCPHLNSPRIRKVVDAFVEGAPAANVKTFFSITMQRSYDSKKSHQGAIKIYLEAAPSSNQHAVTLRTSLGIRAKKVKAKGIGEVVHGMSERADSVVMMSNPYTEAKEAKDAQADLEDQRDPRQALAFAAGTVTHGRKGPQLSQATPPYHRAAGMLKQIHSAPPPPPPRTATAMAALTLPSAVPAPPPPPAKPRRKREALVAAPQAAEPLSRGRVGSDDSDGSDSSANSRTGLLGNTQ